ncbi:MAG: hypothetical protein J7K69_08505 [Thermotogae bacterium]|nr:hypothetical protein [Thermotogota bacterium]
MIEEKNSIEMKRTSLELVLIFVCYVIFSYFRFNVAKCITCS